MRRVQPTAHAAVEKEGGFLVAELCVEAAAENLDTVLKFVDDILDGCGCSPKIQRQLNIAVEELFVNIANYAYDKVNGMVTVQVSVYEAPLRVEITFIDNGKQYDPLSKPDPDITLHATKRNIGGLGIFMVKKNMDYVCYEYKDGKNILLLKKNLT